MPRKIRYCGAFEGVITLRPGETPEDAASRVEETLNQVLYTHAKRMNVTLGVDFGDLRDETAVAS